MYLGYGGCYRVIYLCLVDVIFCIIKGNLIVNYSLQIGDESINFVIGIIEQDFFYDKFFIDSGRYFGKMDVNFVNFQCIILCI